MQRHENAAGLMAVADCMLNKLQYQLSSCCHPTSVVFCSAILTDMWQAKYNFTLCKLR